MSLDLLELFEDGSDHLAVCKKESEEAYRELTNWQVHSFIVQLSAVLLQVSMVTMSDVLGKGDTGTRLDRKSVV